MHVKSGTARQRFVDGVDALEFTAGSPPFARVGFAFELDGVRADVLACYRFAEEVLKLTQSGLFRNQRQPQLVRERVPAQVFEQTGDLRLKTMSG